MLLKAIVQYFTRGITISCWALAFRGFILVRFSAIIHAIYCRSQEGWLVGCIRTTTTSSDSATHGRVSGGLRQRFSRLFPWTPQQTLTTSLSSNNGTARP